MPKRACKISSVGHDNDIDYDNIKRGTRFQLQVDSRGVFHKAPKGKGKVLSDRKPKSSVTQSLHCTMEASFLALKSIEMKLEKQFSWKYGTFPLLMHITVRLFHSHS